MGEQMIATIASREADAQMIARALQEFTGEIVQLPSFTEVKPKKRTSWIDPESKLKRKKPKPPPKELSEAKRAQLAELRARKNIPQEDRPPTHAEIALQHGISRSTLQYRLAKGMTMQEALAPTNPNLRRHGVQKRNRKVLAQEWPA